MLQNRKKTSGNTKHNSILNWEQASPSWVFLQLVWRHSWAGCTVRLFPLCYKYLWDNPTTTHSALTCSKVVVSWYHQHLLGKKPPHAFISLCNFGREIFTAIKAFQFCRNVMCRGLSAALASAWNLINNINRGGFLHRTAMYLTNKPRPYYHIDYSLQKYCMETLVAEIKTRHQKIHSILQVVELFTVTMSCYS